MDSGDYDCYEVVMKSRGGGHHTVTEPNEPLKYCIGFVDGMVQADAAYEDLVAVTISSGLIFYPKKWSMKNIGEVFP